jgi:cbb3-type cytochrome oxidase maturation protein
MDIVYLLVPLSLVLVFAIGVVLWWAIARGQFDDLDREGASIIADAEGPVGVDLGQRSPGSRR